MIIIKSPRIFPNTVNGVVEALEQTFNNNLYADKVVERLLKENRKWGSRDRSFVAESTYEIIRNWRKLWAIYGKEPQFDTTSLTELFGIWWLSQGYKLPEWPAFQKLQDFELEKRMTQIPKEIGITESYPEWFDARASKELGTEWQNIAKALNLAAPLTLRVNTLKTKRAELQKTLAAEGILAAPIKGFDEALKLNSRTKLQHLKSFKDGLYEVQDAGSQKVADFVQAKPGDVVIDSCAGAGGKTLQLASAMQNKGLLVAMDVDVRKLRELEKRAKRNGVSIATTSLIKGNASLKTYLEKADRLLLDVPCSGTGVIKRDVDTKWKLQPNHLEKNIETQRMILKNHTKMLKPGGSLVYATCSIFKSENEDQVQWFLDQFSKKYELEEELRLNPTADNDGFYMARLRKLN